MRPFEYLDAPIGLEGTPNVPPALPLILVELKKSTSWSDGRRRIRAMLPDLRQQSEAFAVELGDSGVHYKRHTKFDVHLHGALDLLSGAGCSEAPCRFLAADRVASSVGLIADRVWLTDLLSDYFIQGGRLTNAILDEVIKDVLVLARLVPLIAAGIVKFRSPLRSTCAACAAEFDRQLNDSVRALLKTFQRDFRIEKRAGGEFVAHTGKCFDPPVVFRGFSPQHRIPAAREFAEQTILDELRSALWIAQEAARSSGVVLSNSRVGLAGLLQREGRLPDRRALVLLDKQRELIVPWVSELTAAQIVQLREEASNALPAFRERVAKALLASDEQSPTSVQDLVAELRQQSAEVRAELQAKQAHSARWWKTTYGLLGLGLSAYGVATDQVLAGVGGLLPILQLLISHQSGHEADVAKLSSRPGYVLVKAQDILAHAH